MARQKPQIDGHKVRRLREELGLNRDQLADETVRRAQVERKRGVTAKTIYRMEHSKAVSPYTRYRVADALGVKPEELLARERVTEGPAPLAGWVSTSVEQGQVGMGDSRDRMQCDILPPEKQSTLIKEVLSYLRNLADECEGLPSYFPSHLQLDGFERMAFAGLRQTVQVITDRRQLDQWLAKQREQMVLQGLEPNPIAYGPRRGIPEQEEEHEGKPEIETLDWDERVSRRFRRAVILGDPGFGKTWLLRYEARCLALEAIRELEDGKSLAAIKVPIFCRLSDLAPSDRPLQDSILEFLRHEHEHQKYREALWRFVGEKLLTDHCVLLLDAWDEVPEKVRLQKRVEAFSRRFSQPGILLTSRIVGYEPKLPPIPYAKELEIVAFDWAKITAFVRVWFGQRTNLGKTFLAKLEKNRQMKGLARIPLMLGLICRACPEGTFPQRRSELYEICLKGLIRDWVFYDRKSAVKDIELDSAYVEILLEQLGTLSLELFQQGYEQFSSLQLVETLGRWYGDEKVLELIWLFKRRGILVAANSSDDPPLVYLHRTFQEYLVARALAAESNAIESALRHLHDPQWHEVLALLGGLLGDRTYSYLAALLRENKNHPLHQPLLLALELATETGKESLPKEFLCGMAEVIGGLYFDVKCPIELSPSQFVPLLGDYMTEVCVRHVREGDLDTQKKAIKALGEIGSPEAVHVLIETLYDESKYVSSYATHALAATACPEAAIALIRVLENRNPKNLGIGDARCDGLPKRHMRTYAAAALGRIGSEQAVVALVQALEDEDVDVRKEAAQALGETGSKPAVAALVQALKDDSFLVRMCAATGLGQVGSEQTVDALVQLLKDKIGYVRCSAASALREIGSEQAIDALVAALKDKSWEVRMHAVIALGRMDSEQAIAALTQALKDEDVVMRAHAASALGHIGSEQVVAALVQVLKDKSECVRCFAAGALGRVGAEQAIEALEQALEDEDANVRRSVASTLGEIASERAITAVAQALKDEDVDVRREATSVLGEIASEQAVAALIYATDDEDPLVRVHAAIALGRMGSEQAIVALVQALEDEDVDVRAHAASALGEMGSEQGVAALVQALKDEDVDVRARAASALGEMGSEQGVAALVQALKDKSEYVRRCAASALGEIGSERTVGALLRALRDDNALVRSTIRKALLRICNRCPSPVSGRSVSASIRHKLDSLAEFLERFASSLESKAN